MLGMHAYFEIFNKMLFPYCKWLHWREGPLKTALAVLIVNACFARYAFDFFRLPE